MGAEGDSALDTAAAMAVAAVSFARNHTEDARLLLTLRPTDLLDGEPDTSFRDTLAAMNAPLIDRVGELARALFGSRRPRAVDAVSRAVVDLPYAVVRRHAHDDPIPSWLEADVGAGVRALLTAHAGH
ncbi:MAG: TetR/AcrR family transcriptional regulator, partial [Mycobacterium sp.]